MVETHTAKNRFFARNLKVKRAIMTEQYRPLFVVRHDDFAVAAAGLQNVADFHGNARFHIPFTGTGYAPRRQKRVADDKSGLQFFVRTVRCAVIVVCKCVKSPFFHQFIERNSNTRRPVELLFRRFSGNWIGSFRLTQREERQHLSSL